MYHAFLLKMTRRLCKEHHERVFLKDNSAISWHWWTMVETLRRTTFLVDMVNELSYHTNALNNVNYESLDESLLLDMPLPAPDRLWRALNAEEWAAARDTSGWTNEGLSTLRTALSRFDADSYRRALRDNDMIGRCESIQQISELIISSATFLRRH